MKKLILIAMFVVPASTAFARFTGIGLGIHGGLISGYKNPVLRDSIRFSIRISS